MSRENADLIRMQSADMARQLSERINNVSLVDEFSDEPWRAKANRESLRELKRVQKLLLKAMEIV